MLWETMQIVCAFWSFHIPPAPKHIALSLNNRPQLALRHTVQTRHYSLWYRIFYCPFRALQFLSYNFSQQIRSTVKLQHVSDLTGPIRQYINPITPNYHDSGRTAPLNSKCCILYIYSTNIGTEYFKHGIYSPFHSLQNAVCFTILTYLVPVLFTFYTQVC